MKHVETVTTWRCDVCSLSHRGEDYPADWRLVGLQSRKSHAVRDALLCKDCKRKLSEALRPHLADFADDLMKREER